jgi:CBS domain-containing protein
VPYAWIVFGSEGRMEQLLLTDQDNALVHGDPPVDDPAAAAACEAYFASLAEKVVAGLQAAGFPPCPGGFMATRWRKPLSAWLDLFRGWIGTPDAAALLDVSSLLDFRPVHGTLDLAPLDAVVRSASERAVFLAHLARTALTFEPPLSPFRQIKEQDGGVDVKKGGLMPIVGMARVFALEAGSGARGTLDRLQAASESGNLSREGATTLAEAFRFLLGLRLRVQLEAARTGSAATNLVRPADLSALERRLLRDTFLAVRELQQATALRLHTERLG